MVAAQLKSVGIVTGATPSGLSEDGHVLQAELERHGVAAGPVVWSDGETTWADYDVLLVRSCWEYHTQEEAFRRWIRTVKSAGTVLLNRAPTIRWNLDKSYLQDLAERGTSVIPTEFVTWGDPPPLRDILRDYGWESAGVEPAVGTSSTDVWRTSADEAPARQAEFASLAAESDVLVQEFAPEINEGERSLVFFQGRFGHALRSQPAADDFRAHPDFGATTTLDTPGPALVDQARAVVETACDVLNIPPEALPYARIDGIERGGEFRLMELELIEPFLGLATAEHAVDVFTDAIESAFERSVAPKDNHPTDEHSPSTQL